MKLGPSAIIIAEYENQVFDNATTLILPLMKSILNSAVDINLMETVTGLFSHINE